MLFQGQKKWGRNEATKFGQEEVPEHLLVIQGELETRERLVSVKRLAYRQTRGRPGLSQTEATEQI